MTCKSTWYTWPGAPTLKSMIFPSDNQLPWVKERKRRSHWRETALPRKLTLDSSAHDNSFQHWHYTECIPHIRSLHSHGNPIYCNRLLPELVKWNGGTSSYGFTDFSNAAKVGYVFENEDWVNICLCSHDNFILRKWKKTKKQPKSLAWGKTPVPGLSELLSPKFLACRGKEIHFTSEVYPSLRNLDKNWRELLRPLRVHGKAKIWRQKIII